MVLWLLFIAQDTLLTLLGGGARSVDRLISQRDSLEFDDEHGGNHWKSQWFSEVTCKLTTLAGWFAKSGKPSQSKLKNTMLVLTPSRKCRHHPRGKWYVKHVYILTYYVFWVYPIINDLFFISWNPSSIIWLVVLTPLKNMKVRWDSHSQLHEWKYKTCSKPQTGHQ